MLQRPKSYLSLFFATLFLTLGIPSSSNWLSDSAIAINKLDPTSEVLISKKSRSTSTRKSGGRSSGGSFKTRSKTKTKPKTRTKSGSANSHSNTNTRKQTTPTVPTYRDRSRNRDYYEPEPYYPEPSYRRRTRTQTYNSSGNNRPVHPLVRLLGFIILFLIIFIPLFILFKFLGRHFNSANRAQRKVTQEITNDIVTISLVQVALSAATIEIQNDLSELSLQANTETPEGLLSLMRDASLVLTRNSETWTHVLAHSQSTNITKAESIFESLSLKQRSKFSDESFSNVDGVIRTKNNPQTNTQEDFTDYVVVTLIFGTVDDQPLFEKITNEQELEATLLKLAAMDEEYLLKFELLWTPQAEGIYLSDEELLLQYSEMLPFI